MKSWLVIIVLLTIPFYRAPLEVLNVYLSYLIPFLFSCGAIILLVFNLKSIQILTGSKRKLAKSLNWLAISLYSLMVIWNFPIPADRGYRNKNWTDVTMLINPDNDAEQYVRQHIEYGGSDMPGQTVKIKPINSWLRWRFKTNRMPSDGKWLLVDNSHNGYNKPPFGLDETKIIYARDKHTARLIVLEDGEFK